jgi:hypothetical protein
VTWVVLLISVALVGLAVAGMAIGVMFRRPCLRGSCGGPEVLDVHGRSLSCSACPNRRRGQHEQTAGDAG